MAEEKETPAVVVALNTAVGEAKPVKKAKAEKADPKELVAAIEGAACILDLKAAIEGLEPKVRNSLAGYIARKMDLLIGK